MSPQAVRCWIDKGLLPAHRTPGGFRRVDPSALVDFLRTYPAPQALLPQPQESIDYDELRRRVREAKQSHEKARMAREEANEQARSETRALLAELVAEEPIGQAVANRRVLELHEQELAQIIEDRVAAALARDRAGRLVNGLEAGLMLGLQPRMAPRPDDPAAAAAWQREHDSKVCKALWARVDRARRGRGDARLLEALVEGRGLHFDQAKLEAYVASLKRGS